MTIYLFIPRYPFPFVSRLRPSLTHTQSLITARDRRKVITTVNKSRIYSTTTLSFLHLSTLLIRTPSPAPYFQGPPYRHPPFAYPSTVSSPVLWHEGWPGQHPASDITSDPVTSIAHASSVSDSVRLGPTSGWLSASLTRRDEEGCNSLVSVGDSLQMQSLWACSVSSSKRFIFSPISVPGKYRMDVTGCMFLKLRLFLFLFLLLLCYGWFYEY